MCVDPRPLSKVESEHIKSVLKELRDHFHQWSSGVGYEMDLIRFAYYEGCDESSCCQQVLKKASALVTGQELVDKHNYKWCMLLSKGEWRYGLIHSSQDNPVDLYNLDVDPIFDSEEHDKFLREDILANLDYGWGANESYHALSKINLDNKRK